MHLVGQLWENPILMDFVWTGRFESGSAERQLAILTLSQQQHDGVGTELCQNIRTTKEIRSLYRFSCDGIFFCS